MFVRFSPSPRRLQLSLVETRREAGKVRHEHVASLGAVPSPLTVAGRVEYWQDLHQRLGRLSNRLDDETKAKILGAVHARIPMPAVDEIHALNLDEAKQHEAAWRMRHVNTDSIVEENKLRLKAAERSIADGEPLVASAAEEVKAADERRGRIERGENLPLPGKPPSLKELGITRAHMRHMRRSRRSLRSNSSDFLISGSDPLITRGETTAGCGASYVLKPNGDQHHDRPPGPDPRV